MQLKSALRETDGYDAQLSMLAPGGGAQGAKSAGAPTSGVADASLKAEGAEAPQTRLRGPADVRWLQQSLNDAGFDAGEVDGLMGPRTRAAIHGFQRARGLAVDGIVGPQTLAALRGGEAEHGGAGPAKSGGAGGASGTAGSGGGAAGGVTGGSGGAAGGGGDATGNRVTTETTSGGKTGDAGPVGGTANVGGSDRIGGGGGTDVEVGGGETFIDVGIGATDDLGGAKAAFSVGKSFGIGRNICGPIYVSGSVGGKITGELMQGKTTGLAIKGSVSAEIRLGVGAAAVQGGDGFEIGAGGELKGQGDLTFIGAAWDKEDGVLFDHGIGVLEVGVNGYIMAQAFGAGPKITIPARKYKLYEVIAHQYAKGEMKHWELREGPDWPRLMADIQAVVDEAKAAAHKVADKVDEVAPEVVKDKTADVVSYIIEGRSEDDRKDADDAARAAMDASWEQFRAWWDGRRTFLAQKGVLPHERDGIFNKYVEAWKLANPDTPGALKNEIGAAAARLQAQAMEETAMKAAAERWKNPKTAPPENSAIAAARQQMLSAKQGAQGAGNYVSGLLQQRPDSATQQQHHQAWQSWSSGTQLEQQFNAAPMGSEAAIQHKTALAQQAAHKFQLAKQDWNLANQIWKGG